MTYRDDFYIVDNIVAYTGDINNNPTVYFEHQVADGVEFGRITQHHQHADNIGRNKVRVKADYRLENRRMVNNTYLCGLVVTRRTVCVEYYDGGDRHTSRNAATFRDDFAANDLALLAQAITRFPDAKSKT
jgi:hypothetical protein